MESYSKNDIQSMVNEQIRINDIILNEKCDVQQIKLLKIKLKNLQDDIKNFYTSTCYICGDQHMTNSHNMEREHITINNTWGYHSLYDCQQHKLVLCNHCYKDHIMNGFLGKYVKVTQY
jgi:hypothetical protein